jgi:hypothetical protein
MADVPDFSLVMPRTLWAWIDVNTRDVFLELTSRDAPHLSFSCALGHVLFLGPASAPTHHVGQRVAECSEYATREQPSHVRDPYSS